MRSIIKKIPTVAERLHAKLTIVKLMSCILYRVIQQNFSIFYQLDHICCQKTIPCTFSERCRLICSADYVFSFWSFPAQRPVTRMFSLICIWLNGWVNNREAGDLRRYSGYYDVTVLTSSDHVLLFWGGKPVSDKETKSLPPPSPSPLCFIIEMHHVCCMAWYFHS